MLSAKNRTLKTSPYCNSNAIFALVLQRWQNTQVLRSSSEQRAIRKSPDYG